MTLHSVPWGLSFYTPLVGGAPGAASLGLNRTFWGYTTGALQGFINQRAPRHGNVYVHDTALQSWEMLRVDGRIRADLRGTLAIPGSALALYHHEPHMRRVEYQTLAGLRTRRARGGRHVRRRARGLGVRALGADDQPGQIVEARGDPIRPSAQLGTAAQRTQLATIHGKY